MKEIIIGSKVKGVMDGLRPFEGIIHKKMPTLDKEKMDVFKLVLTKPCKEFKEGETVLVTSNEITEVL